VPGRVVFGDGTSACRCFVARGCWTAKSMSEVCRAFGNFAPKTATRFFGFDHKWQHPAWPTRKEKVSSRVQGFALGLPCWSERDSNRGSPREKRTTLFFFETTLITCPGPVFSFFLLFSSPKFNSRWTLARGTAVRIPLPLSAESPVLSPRAGPVEGRDPAFARLRAAGLCLGDRVPGKRRGKSGYKRSRQLLGGKYLLSRHIFQYAVAR